MNNIKTILKSCSKLELKQICTEMKCSSHGTKNDIITRLLLPLNLNFNMSKKSNFQTQCDKVRDEFFRKSGFFDDDYEEELQTKILNKEQQISMLTTYLNDILNTAEPNTKHTIMYVLYLGNFGPPSYSKNKNTNVGRLYNCLYNQIINFRLKLEEQNKLNPQNKTKLAFVYVQCIVPPEDPCNNIPTEILDTLILTEYLRVNLPKNQDEYKLEQLYVLKNLIDNNIAPIMMNVDTNKEVEVKNIRVNTNQFEMQLSSNEIIPFEKPTIPESVCSFLPVLKNIMETFLNTVKNSKVIIINGFWYDTTTAPQSRNYIIKNCQKILGNGLLGSILYFYPLIWFLKQNYGDRFAVTSQYGDKLLKRMRINKGCNDLTTFLLEQICELTTNGRQFC
jgi:hypothetical protein